MQVEFGVKYFKKTQTLVVLLKGRKHYRVVHMSQKGVDVNTYPVNREVTR